jgi:hypothetical protein
MQETRSHLSLQGAAEAADNVAMATIRGLAGVWRGLTQLAALKTQLRRSESPAVRTLRGHVSEAELCAAQHAHDYTLAHEGVNGPAPSYL